MEFAGTEEGLRLTEEELRKSPATDGADATTARAGVCIAVVVVVAVFLMALQPVRSPDVWHHVGAGRLVYETGGAARADVFSCTARGKRWVQYEWLAQLLIFAAHEAGGVAGLILFRACGAALAALLLLLASRARRAERRAGQYQQG